MIPEPDRFVHLTEGARPIEDGKDRMYFCELSRYYSANVFRNFSIKYTLEGEVHYRTSQASYALKPNTFLLSSKQPCICEVASGTLTRNLSIDISAGTFEDVLTTLRQLDPDLDAMANGYFMSADFFEHQYSIRTPGIGPYLQQMGTFAAKTKHIPASITDSLFYDLAQVIIGHEKVMGQSLQHLDSSKAGTRRETLKRLLVAKEFMEDQFTSTPSIPEIAKHAHLSPYYFLRNFKKAFQISPHQYLLEKRLQLAAQLLEQKQSMQEVASRCGFADAPSFSKAFRKKYGYAPSMRWRNGNG